MDGVRATPAYSYRPQGTARFTALQHVLAFTMVIHALLTLLTIDIIERLPQWT